MRKTLCDNCSQEIPTQLKDKNSNLQPINHKRLYLGDKFKIAISLNDDLCLECIKLIIANSKSFQVPTQSESSMDSIFDDVFGNVFGKRIFGPLRQAGSPDLGKPKPEERPNE